MVETYVEGLSCWVFWFLVFAFWLDLIKLWHACMDEMVMTYIQYALCQEEVEGMFLRGIFLLNLDLDIVLHFLPPSSGPFG